MKVLPTGKQMREADLYTIQHIGIPSMVLMERAALQVVEVMEKEITDLSKILIVCGSGNNGGDGYAIARLLYLKGYDVTIWFVGNDTSRSEENKSQKSIADYYQIPTIDVPDNTKYSVIVDAIFGSGLNRNIEGRYYDVISEMNQMPGIKVAVDIPSGIHDTSGKVMGIAFCAHVTVAIAFMKRGVAMCGKEYAGKVSIGDIGITEDSIPVDEVLSFGFEETDLIELFPKRKSNSHKGTYGRVLLIVGSKGMSGAAFLSAKAAYAVGAGLVQIYTAEENRVILQQLLPEAIISTYQKYDEEQLKQLLDWADVIGIGSGLGKNESAKKIVRFTLHSAKCPCVVDADALNILSQHMEWLKNINQEMIFTPHMKEMARLLDCSVQELNAERFEKLLSFIEVYPVVCTLKDARTIVAKNGKKVYLNLSGNAAMAKAGSGDVLTGIIAGIVGQGVSAFDAACLGVYLHGLAGDVARDQEGSYSVLASDIINGISSVLKKL